MNIQHRWNGSYWENFGPLLPQIWSNIAEILSKSSTLANKNIVWKKFEGFELSQKRGGSKFSLLVQLWPLVFPWRWPKSKKIRSSGEKLQLLGHANMSKSRLYLLSPFQEKQDYYLLYLGFFAMKQVRITNQGIRIKTW